jgi:hypothetical protein
VLPIALIVLCAQRRIVSGLTAGSLRSSAGSHAKLIVSTR